MYRSNLLFLYLHLVLSKGLLFCPVVCHALAFSSGALAAQVAHQKDKCTEDEGVLVYMNSLLRDYSRSKARWVATKCCGSLLNNF